ncbi:phosphoenolpyruvate--protein phosphotransferase [Anaerocolumna xylanovorans]|uniref:Phosphoenolpyruvate-protein phosphotransferase n=1 Tax=Anaerocolumna xylanovorans DSM 12503 TaxID=1121345 RepID=A0A1M7YL39_9FIRM|nr:phosphoenolpyruvate--protein phosphotransferase [Anaerocolumna xylanovorans]SHO53341.1 phosphotransferase system, enzyme I, PtsI [Anaerocolumna xylanovorans DSM 12503]
MKTWKVKKTYSRGYALGPARIIEKKEIRTVYDKITGDNITAEIKRFDEAVEEGCRELMELSGKSEIFAAHAALASDIALREGVENKIKDKLMCAEEALLETSGEFVFIFESMEDEYMRERAADMKDVCERLLTILSGENENPFEGIEEKSIIIARELTPSDTAKMNLKLVAGFVMELGGATSHVSIMAKNLGIPCLTGAEGVLKGVKDKDFIIMDAGAGEIFAEPSKDLIEEYEEKAGKWREEEKRLRESAGLPSLTKDGIRFELCANAGNPEEVRGAAEYEIDGIGLFRSEFLYMGSDHFPTEEEQFFAYKEAACLLKDKELTIRTLDIGGDKELKYWQLPKEENPFLGYRAIRICLKEPDIFKPQLRAILRAGAFGNVRIMYPMITSVEEIREANKILEQCKKELEEEGIPYKKDIQTGIMIETPAAVMIAEELAKEADFFSIGTNDLTQYFLAADRGNEKVAEIYNSYHPSVLRAIAATIRAAHKQGIKAGMCGEFASDEKAAVLLLGMGLDEFSMSAGEISRVKSRLRETDYKEAKETADNILSKGSVTEVINCLI